MGMPVKVSVIVPVYNVEDFLPKCLESCIKQTLYDIEIICVNDGSTDNSAKILKAFAEADPRIIVIEQENAGLASARNAGLKIAQGRWIMFLDSDDYYLENACERVWLESVHEKTDIVIFGSEIFPVYPEVDQWYKDTLYTFSHRFYDFEPYILFNMPGGKPFVWRQAFSRKLLVDLEATFEEGNRFGEDLIFQFKVLPFARNISVISDRIYNYRWCREGSLMDAVNKDLEMKVSEHVRMVGIITDYWYKKGLLNCYGKEYFAWLLQFMVPLLYKREKKHAHAKQLREIVSKYKLAKYGDDLEGEDKRLAVMLNGM